MKHAGRDAKGEFLAEFWVIGSVRGQLFITTSVAEKFILHEVQVTKDLEDWNTICGWHKDNLQRGRDKLIHMLHVNI